MNFVFDNDRPIYIQLVEFFKKNIISGKIKSGERISSVRELALELKVNPNTILRALTELENIGLIYTERTNGKFVTDDEEIIKRLREEYASLVATNFFKDMEEIGYSKSMAIKYLKEK